MRRWLGAAAAGAGLSLAAVAGGQDNKAMEEIQKYRQMLQEGNPAELLELRGEELWATPRDRARRRWSAATWGWGRASWKVPTPSFRATSQTPARCRTLNPGWSPA